ncbi:MAG: helix-turn-helix domain-containing protein [Clostridiales Family XIII bacterium]|jgi:transcriptional regulator with XRE-family HTH domain|nr:helix-turn-helix domain-containing protein [Clostridiales Family XIII bacterium]
MSIDTILKQIRKKLAISQESLARELSVSFATLNRWENNRVRPSRLGVLQLRDFCVAKGLSEGIIAALNNQHVKK